MRNWGLLLGLAAVLAALVIAGGDTVLAGHALPAGATLVKEVFTIPLAATVKL